MAVCHLLLSNCVPGRHQQDFAVPRGGVWPDASLTESNNAAHMVIESKSTIDGWRSCPSLVWMYRLALIKPNLCVYVCEKPQSENRTELIHWPAAIHHETQRQHERSVFALHSTSIAKYFLTSHPESHAVLSVSHFSFLCHCFNFSFIFLFMGKYSTEHGLPTSDQLSAWISFKFYIACSN